MPVYVFNVKIREVIELPLKTNEAALAHFKERLGVRDDSYCSVRVQKMDETCRTCDHLVGAGELGMHCELCLDPDQCTDWKLWKTLAS